jgi:hypothetical protein
VKRLAREAISGVTHADDLGRDCPWKCKRGQTLCLCRDMEVVKETRYRVTKDGRGRAVIKNLETGNVRILPDRN